MFDLNSLKLKMVAQILPTIEKNICSRLRKCVFVNDNEYAAYVLTNVNGKAKISLCIFQDNTCKRIVWSESAALMAQQYIDESLNA